MIERYADKVIAGIWTDEAKLSAWQDVELAVIWARLSLGLVKEQDYLKIQSILKSTPVDIAWWKEREKKTNHDLQAWVEERVRHLPVELRPRFHEGMTSYDTEETAFLIMLKQSTTRVFVGCVALETALRALALSYRFCPMMGVTHGQHAEIQTFGKRCLTWLQDVFVAETKISENLEALKFSRLSGAIGNYGGVTPEIEKVALETLGFKPFYGATQILPRQLFVPLASSLATLVLVVSKIGTDIRLGARSPRPIYQEPFGKSQTGSSRMPHKKNTIACEQLEGLGRMTLGVLTMITQNVTTWEERAIEQSCVERVAWPDLFHVVMRSLTACTKVMEGLQVYPDNMVQSIIDTRGTWAAGPAKEFLRERLAVLDVNSEDAYRIVQLASFIAFQPSDTVKSMRKLLPTSLDDANRALQEMEMSGGGTPASIERIIRDAELRVIPELDITVHQVDAWRAALLVLFSKPEVVTEWRDVFSIQNRLRDEAALFKQILKV